MKRTKVLLVAALSLSLAASLFLLSACGGETSSTSVAATVNGIEIMEQDITDAIVSMRSQSEAYDEDAAWAQALSVSGLTPESLRESVIDSKVKEIIIAQEAEAQGIVVDEAQIEETIAQTRETVGATDDDAWTTILQQYNFKDEQAYREMLINGELGAQLTDAFEYEPTDEELAEFIAENPTAVEGFTLPGTEEAPAEEEPAESEGEAEENTEPVATEEEAGEEGVPVDDPADAPAEESESEPALTAADIDLSAIPADILTQFTEAWKSVHKGTAYQEWLNERVEAADVVINEMPEDVPYNVDMSLADTPQSTDGDNADGDNADGNEAEVSAEPADFSSPEGIQYALDAGLIITDDVVGEGAEAVSGSSVSVHYVGTLEDGTEFDSSYSRDTPYNVVLGTGNVIKGWEAGLVGMKVGGTRTLTIPPSLAYGSTGSGSVPPDATLTFVVELLEVTE